MGWVRSASRQQEVCCLEHFTAVGHLNTVQVAYTAVLLLARHGPRVWAIIAIVCVGVPCIVANGRGNVLVLINDKCHQGAAGQRVLGQ
jgi:uncharacterized metal-binding protein